MRLAPILLALLLAGCARRAGPPPPQPRVLASALQSNAVFSIDPVSFRLAAGPAAVPEGPAGMAGRDGLVWVALLGRPYLAVLDAAALTEVRRLSLGAPSSDAALNPAGDTLAVALPTRGEVALLRPDGTGLRRIPTQGDPYAVAWSPDGRDVYATNPARGSLQRLDIASGKVVRETRLGLGPRGLAVADERVLVALYDENALAVVEKEIRRLPLGSGPYDVLPTGGGALVSLPEEGVVAAVDLQTGTLTALPVGAGASGMARTPDGQFVFVACEAAGEVVVLGLHDNTVVGRIALPSGARPRESVLVQ